MPEAEEMPGFPDAVGIGEYCVTIRYKHEAKQANSLEGLKPPRIT